MPSNQDLNIGLNRIVHGDTKTEIIAAAALCRSYLRQGSDTETLTSRLHRAFGHDCYPTIEALSIIDDEFGTLDYIANPTRDQLVARTQQAAQKLFTEAEEILAQRGKAPHT